MPFPLCHRPTRFTHPRKQESWCAMKASYGVLRLVLLRPVCLLSRTMKRGVSLKYWIELPRNATLAPGFFEFNKFVLLLSAVAPMFCWIGQFWMIIKTSERIVGEFSALKSFVMAPYPVLNSGFSSISVETKKMVCMIFYLV